MVLVYVAIYRQTDKFFVATYKDMQIFFSVKFAASPLALLAGGYFFE